ncbi:MAG: hypothetical protein WA996_04745 [Candidatus Promineifilaceae bacterium]
MYNFNRDILQAEHERSERLSTAASRQVPLHLRVDNGKRLKNWLATEVTGPAKAALMSLTSLAVKESARYWRRSSSRASGLAANVAKSLVPG